MRAILKSINTVSEAVIAKQLTPQETFSASIVQDLSHLVKSISEVSIKYLERPIEKIVLPFKEDNRHLIESLKIVSKSTSSCHVPVSFQSSIEESLLNFLNKEENENFHSDFLSGLLDSKKSKGLAGSFFRELVQFATGDKVEVPGHVVSRRELALCELVPNVRDEIASRRIDILAHSDEYLIVIENKVNTFESTSQTTDYHEVTAQFNSNLIRPKKVVEILLSPRGDMPECSSYVPMTYHHLFRILLDLKSSHGATPYLDLYLESLYQNYFKTNQRYKDFITEFWRNYER